MTRSVAAAVAILTAGALSISASASAAGGAAHLEHADLELGSVTSLQRGARNFMNYCSGCHSAKYVRYRRLGEDLGLTDEQVTDNLMFAGEKMFDTIQVAMPAADARRWFGVSPPDLSLTARSRGTDWIFSYLKSFYVDETRPVGVNNLVLVGSSMPHVLWELQGLQRLVFREEVDDQGNAHEVFDHFEPVTAGLLNEAEYEIFVRDIVNFLAYIGEPVQLERRSLGVRVLAFILLFFLLAYALKREFWRDVH